MKKQLGNVVEEIKDSITGKVVRRRVRFYCDPVSKTKQSMAAATDINNIMSRYEKTGLIDHIKEGGSYGDFSKVSDYHEAMNQVIKANDGFLTLPAKLRKKFDNDPAKLIEFMNDPKNKEEAIKLGLMEQKEEKIIKKQAVIEPEAVQSDKKVAESKPK